MTEKEKLIEMLNQECAEVVQALSKARLFGFDTVYDGETNLSRLQQEIGDILAVAIVMNAKFPELLSDEILEQAVKNKIHKMKRYFEFLKDFDLGNV